MSERILSYGLAFMFSLLEDPNIWRSIMLGIEDSPNNDDGEERKGDDLEAERFCETVLFTRENTMQIYQALTRKYLVYTTEEIEAWMEDPLKFFLDAKNESNECKGNFLREKAQRLLAGTQLHLDAHFTEFCGQVASELSAMPAASNLSIEQQVQKDAMMQILNQRLSQ